MELSSKILRGLGGFRVEPKPMSALLPRATAKADSPLVGSSRNTCPLSHSPAADRTRKRSPLVTGIFVLSVRECHGRAASKQTQGTNEMALRIGLRNF